jgi:RNA recognition motif-containing protein
MSTTSSSSAGSSQRRSVLPSLKRKREDEAYHSESDHDQTSSSSDSEAEAEASPEVPALSHAERRRQKKKKGKHAGSNDSPPGKKRKINPSSTVPKRQNSVWVGNLSFKTTVASLRTFFDGVGEITRIHMPMKASTRGPLGSENRGLVDSPLLK